MQYQTIAKAAQDEFVEKRSRFIGYAKPVVTEAEAIAFVEEIRAKHREATHNVYAYIVRENNIARYSDDGEPHGTAGMPVLEVMRGAELQDLAVVVTRYFGGTLLGTGGLVRAYGKGAKIAIEAAGIVRMALCDVCSMTFDYSYYARLQALVYRFGGTIRDSDFGSLVTLRFALPEEQSEAFGAALTETTFGDVSCELEQKEFVAMHAETIGV